MNFVSHFAETERERERDRERQREKKRKSIIIGILANLSIIA